MEEEDDRDAKLAALKEMSDHIGVDDDDEDSPDLFDEGNKRKPKSKSNGGGKGMMNMDSIMGMMGGIGG